MICDYLIVGLGNPGSKYENTRHNVGFWFIDDFYHGDFVQKFNSLFAKTVIYDKKIILLKPQTYMNLSGMAISEFMEYYKIPIYKLIIIFDDISLPIGKIRIRNRGSSGGHNGVNNIITSLGSRDFKRIKIGVGQKPAAWDLADWVLSCFNTDEKLEIINIFKNIKSAIKLILNNKINESMNYFN
ncbi:MAG: aminoacyl-tRNA hydrolase [Candidatus Improbicoccus devescovinae]|nr:MAG: aminoacyl-tRNA hydrolase [Candidatus Improbicoccus devescovinae]